MQLSINKDILARNAILNLFGQGLPLIVGVIALPYIIEGLGTARFGLLSLAWVIIGYFGIFDLGLGKTTIKFLSEAIGRNEQGDVSSIFWTAFTVQFVLGIIGCMVLLNFTPLLINHILNISSEHLNEARDTFYCLAIGVPVVLTSSSFRGVLEATQRFDLVNIVKIPSQILTFLLPILGLLLGMNLPGIVSLILLARSAALIAYLKLDFSVVPVLKKYSISIILLPKLFSFSGWIAISGFAGPVLVYLDRFIIGSQLTMSDVGYYSAPYEAVTRLFIIPVSLASILFPAFSSLEGLRDRQKLADLFGRSIKYIFLLLGPLIILIIIFADHLLGFWLGSEFANKSTVVLQILAAGILINAIAFVPFSFLQGVGRPDLPAKFHLIELPTYIITAWFFVNAWGIKGAACAWALRVSLDALLLLYAVSKISSFRYQIATPGNLLSCAGMLVTLTGIAFFLKAITVSLPLFMPFLIMVALLILFDSFLWFKILDESEKGIVLRFLKIGRNKNR